MTRLGRLSVTILALFFCDIPGLGAADAPSGSSVWFAGHRSIHRVDPVAQVIDLSIPLEREATALAVDPDQQDLWALSHKHLLKFSAQTGLILERGLNDLVSPIEDPDALVLDPHDASVWIRAKKTLLHLDSDAGMLFQWQAADKIVALDLDNDGSPWLVTKQQLLHLSPGGSVLGSQELAGLLDETEHLALDALGGVIWLASRRQLVRIDLGDITQLPRPIGIGTGTDIRHVALDRLQGDLWVVNAGRLLRYDRAGNLLVNVDLSPAGLEEVEALAVDSLGRSLWLGAKRRLAHFSADGQVLAEIAIGNELEALAVAGIGPTPELSLWQPSPGARTNNPSPLIRLGLGASCNGIPCATGETYLAGLRLDVLLNGAAVGNRFVRYGNYADYAPPVPLPEGENLLVARATDVFGHSSPPLEGRFVVDTTPPRFLPLSPPSQSILTAPETAISGGVDDPAASVTVEDLAALGGTVVSSDPLNFAFKLPLNHGANRFTVTAQDQVMNRSAVTLDLIYQQPISIEVTSFSNGATLPGTSTTVAGVLSAPPGSTLSVNGIAAPVNANGSFSIAGVPLSPGTNTLTLVVTAPDGRTVTQSMTVTIVTGGAGGWSPDTTIISTGSGDFVRAAMNAAGQAVVAWRQQEGSNKYIFASRFRPGTGWSAPQRIGTSDTNTFSLPDVAMDAAGNAMAIWSQNDYDADSIYANYCPADQEWDTTQTLRIENSSEYAYLPQVAMNPDGKALAVWLQKVGGTYHVHANRFEIGSGWGTPERIENGSGAALVNSTPRVALDAQGNAMAVWSQSDATATNIYANRYQPGQGWGQPQPIETGGALAERPALAMDAVGNAIAVWRQSDGTAASIYANRYVSGGGWGSAVLLESAVETADDQNIAMDASGRALAAWVQREGTFDAVYASRFEPGQGWSTPEKLAGGLIAANIHAVTYANGQGAVLWTQRNPDRFIFDLHASRSIPGGGWTLPEAVEVSDVSVRSADLAADGQGNILAVWGQDQVYARFFSPQAAGGPILRVTPPPDISIEATAALTPVELGTATAVDDVDGPLTAAPDKSGPFGLGTHVITWRATNTAGRAGTAIQLVTVRDTTPPVLTAPPAITVAVSESNQIPLPVELGTPAASDLFAPVAFTHDAPAAFLPGTTVVTWTATDPSGNQSQARQVVTVNFTGPLYVAVTYPEPGASLAGDSLGVSGQLQGALNTGVTVNGVVATVVGDRFYANNVPLAPGENVLTITATSPDGTVQTVTLTVFSSGASPFRLTAEPASGVAPLKVAFRIDNQTDGAIQNIAADFDGDGAVDFVTIDPAAPIEHTYTSPGVYSVKVIVTDSQNVTSDQTLTIAVYDAIQMDQLFQDIWGGLNDALLAGDIATASQYLNVTARQRYQPVFEALLVHMPEIIASYSPLRQVSVSENIGEYSVIRSYGGKNHIYLIYFLRDVDGVWRLDAM